MGPVVLRDAQEVRIDGPSSGVGGAPDGLGRSLERPGAVRPVGAGRLSRAADDQVEPPRPRAHGRGVADHPDRARRRAASRSPSASSRGRRSVRWARSCAPGFAGRPVADRGSPRCSGPSDPLPPPPWADGSSRAHRVAARPRPGDRRRRLRSLAGGGPRRLGRGQPLLPRRHLVRDRPQERSRDPGQRVSRGRQRPARGRRRDRGGDRLHRRCRVRPRPSGFGDGWNPRRASSPSPSRAWSSRGATSTRSSPCGTRSCSTQLVDPGSTSTRTIRPTTSTSPTWR